MNDFGDISISVHTLAGIARVSNQLLEDANPPELSPAERRRYKRRRAKEVAKEKARADCGAVLTDPGEGLYDMGECHLPAGHPGAHEVIIDWPRGDFDLRPLGTPVPDPA